MNKKNMIAVVMLMLFLLSGCGREEIVFESTGNEQQTISVSENAAESETVKELKECYVDVGGAVCSPGVYKVSEGTRIYEVLLLAGGMTTDAEETCINQALEIYDGLKLVVPTKEEWTAGEFVINEKEMVVRKQIVAEQAFAETGKQADDGLVNINAKEMLMSFVPCPESEKRGRKVLLHTGRKTEHLQELKIFKRLQV